MSTTHSAPSQTRPQKSAEVLQVIVYGHSALFYWWPLWAAGYVMAVMTWLNHDEVMIGGEAEYFHPSQNLGVIYTLLFLLLIVITSARRAIASKRLYILPPGVDFDKGTAKDSP